MTQAASSARTTTTRTNYIKTRLGNRLALDEYGASNHQSVIFAHGAGQTRHAWKGSAERLAAAGWKTVALDLRGHGDSDWIAGGDYRLESFAADLLDVADRLTDRHVKPHLVGASLGGLSGVCAEGLMRPGAFASLTLVDITPNMDLGGVMKVLGFMSAHLETGFASLEEAGDVVATYMTHRPRPATLDGLKKNLRLRDDGRWYWHWDPKLLTGRQRPNSMHRVAELEGAISEMRLPVHLIRGRMSELVTEDAVADFMRLAPHARFTDVAGARHMIAGDRNDAFTDAVMSFFAEIAE